MKPQLYTVSHQNGIATIYRAGIPILNSIHWPYRMVRQATVINNILYFWGQSTGVDIEPLCAVTLPCGTFRVIGQWHATLIDSFEMGGDGLIIGRIENRLCGLEWNRREGFSLVRIFGNGTVRPLMRIAAPEIASDLVFRATSFDYDPVIKQVECVITTHSTSDNPVAPVAPATLTFQL